MAAVALVLDQDFGDQVISLAQRMPVWIVSSEINMEAVNLARPMFEDGRITTILNRVGEAPEDFFARALYAIDEHHGELSHPSAYRTLWVLGVGAERMMTSDLVSELGFKSITTTTDGFKAER